VVAQEPCACSGVNSSAQQHNGIVAHSGSARAVTQVSVEKYTGVPVAGAPRTIPVHPTLFSSHPSCDGHHRQL